MSRRCPIRRRAAPVGPVAGSLERARAASGPDVLDQVAHYMSERINDIENGPGTGYLGGPLADMAARFDAVLTDPHETEEFEPRRPGEGADAT